MNKFMLSRIPSMDTRYCLAIALAEADMAAVFAGKVNPPTAASWRLNLLQAWKFGLVRVWAEYHKLYGRS
jgi:hypothetical protein